MSDGFETISLCGHFNDTKNHFVIKYDRDVGRYKVEYFSDGELVDFCVFEEY